MAKTVKELLEVPGIVKGSEIRKPESRGEVNPDHVCKGCGWILVAGRCSQKDCKKQGKLQ